MKTGEKLIRWILFLPAGFLSMMLFAGAIRFSNPNMPFIADLVVAFGEYWVFFAAALYVVPKHYRKVILTCATLAIVIHVLIVYVLISNAPSAYSWPEVLVDISLIAGVVTSSRYFYMEYDESR